MQIDRAILEYNRIIATPRKCYKTRAVVISIANQMQK